MGAPPPARIPMLFGLLLMAANPAAMIDLSGVLPFLGSGGGAATPGTAVTGDEPHLDVMEELADVSISMSVLAGILRNLSTGARPRSNLETLTRMVSCFAAAIATPNLAPDFIFDNFNQTLEAIIRNSTCLVNITTIVVCPMCSCSGSSGGTSVVVVPTVPVAAATAAVAAPRPAATPASVPAPAQGPAFSLVYCCGSGSPTPFCMKYPGLSLVAILMTFIHWSLYH